MRGGGRPHVCPYTRLLWAWLVLVLLPSNARGGPYALVSPEADLRGAFTIRGALLSHHGSTLGVQTTRWGCPGALAQVSPGLTELWASTREGFEQSWRVDQAPSCGADLQLEVAISGARVSGSIQASGQDGTLLLDGDDGTLWSVGAFSAWDADGRSLVLDVEQTAEGFRVRVQVVRARYPLIIDPVYSVAATTLDGESEGDRFGCDVSGAGDVDGDGFDDVIVGAHTYGGIDGAAYVYYGSPAGIPSAAATTLTEGDATTFFGDSVSGAGDVDGDGYADVIVGASGTDPGGNAFVYAGSADGISTSAATTLDDTGHSTYFGRDLASAGDVNGDGYADIIVGADADWGGFGAYVYEGSETGVDSESVAIPSPGRGDDFGRAVSGAGDINGDGYDDVVVGAPGSDEDDLGSAYVYLGAGAGVSTTEATSLVSETTHSALGWAVSGAGDVDGDSFDDLVVGEAGYDHERGRAHLLRGSPDGVNMSDATVLDGEDDDFSFGISVSRAGDVDGDGYDDVFIGTWGYWGYVGRAYLFLGSPRGTSRTASTTLTGEAEDDNYGWRLSSAGDVNGNGLDDLIVAAQYHDSGTGRAYVYLDAGDTDGDGYPSADDCDDTESAIHPGAEEVACDCVDQDCDGSDLREGCGTETGDPGCGEDTGTIDSGDTGAEDSGDTSAEDSGDTGDMRPDGSDTGTGPLGDTGASKTGCGSGCAQTPGPSHPPWALALLALLGWRQKSGLRPIRRLTTLTL